MTTQPEVQRLIEDLSYVAKYSDSEHWNTLAEVATELRRLVAQRDALLEALKQIEPILARMYGPQAAELPPMQIVDAAIKAAEENT